jgi:hypothetical protein
MSVPPRGAKIEDSRRGGAFRAGFPALAPLPAALLFAGLAGALLLVAAELSTLVEVSVAGSVIDRVGGAEQHSYAVGLLGLIALVLAAAAVVVPSRPAALALAAVGVIVLAIVLLGDLPDVRRTGLNRALQPAAAAPGIGFWLEIAGGAVLVAAGVSIFRAAEGWRGGRAG